MIGANSRGAAPRNENVGGKPPTKTLISQNTPSDRPMGQGRGILEKMAGRKDSDSETVMPAECICRGGLLPERNVSDAGIKVKVRPRKADPAGENGTMVSREILHFLIAQDWGEETL